MHVLPYVAVAPCVADVLDEVQGGAVDQESVWVNAYIAAPERCTAETSVQIKKGAHGVEITSSSPAFPVEAKSARCVAVQSQSTVKTPWVDVCIAEEKGGIPFADGPRGAWRFALSVSASGMERWCAGGPSGALHVGEWANSTDPFRTPIPLAGHASDITSVRFFPSGEVVLTTSLDMRAKIYSAIDGSNPRTLAGHTRAVYCSAILGRGREVLTGSADGTVRVWDVGQATTKTTLTAPDHAAVLALDVDEEHAYGGLASGQLAVWALSGGAPRLVPVPAAPGGEAGRVQALAVDLAAHRLALGTSSGVCAVYDTRDLAAVATFWRNTAEVTDVHWAGAELLVSTSDGLPFRASLAPQVLVEYAGWDADPVDALRPARGGVVAVGAGEYARYAENCTAAV